MPFHLYRCPVCGYELKTKKGDPKCGHGKENLDLEDYEYMEKVLTAPIVKLQETDPGTGKSKMQDQDKILKARARNYSRDHELDDLIAKNDRPTAKQNEWLVEDGSRKRKAVDDL